MNKNNRLSEMENDELIATSDVINKLLNANKNVDVRIKKLRNDAVIPKYTRDGDAGFDLVAVEDVIIEPGETKLVKTGVAMAIPEGYELQVRPRSGVSLKTKLRISNSPGTIDSNYRGEIGVIIDNLFETSQGHDTDDNGVTEFYPIKGETYDIENEAATDISFNLYTHGSYIIRKGERIAQGVLKQVPIANFQVVDELDDTVRGTDGYGSSGTNVKEDE